MSQMQGCTCCDVSSEKKEVSTKPGASGKTPKCELKAEKKPDANQSASTFDVPVIAALSTAPLVSPPPLPEFEAVKIHLVVPRIRPPDPGLHGLRAPPAR